MVSPVDDGSWSITAIKAYFDLRTAEQDKAIITAMTAAEKATTTAMTAAEKAVSTAMTAAEKAVTKAEASMEKRFDSVNEFRKTLSDQATNFLTRIEYQAEHRALIDKVDTLTRTQNYLIGGLIMISFLEPLAITYVGRLIKW